MIRSCLRPRPAVSSSGVRSQPRPLPEGPLDLTEARSPTPSRCGRRPSRARRHPRRGPGGARTPRRVASRCPRGLPRPRRTRPGRMPFAAASQRVVPGTCSSFPKPPSASRATARSNASNAGWRPARRSSAGAAPPRRWTHPRRRLSVPSARARTASAWFTCHGSLAVRATSRLRRASATAPVRVAARQPDQRADAPARRLHVVRRPRGSCGDELVRPLDGLVPAAGPGRRSVPRMRPQPALLEGVTKALSCPPATGEELEGGLELALQRDRRGEKAVGARALGRPDRLGHRKAALEVLPRTVVTARQPRHTDVVERLGPQVVQPELLRHCERLAADGDRVFRLASATWNRARVERTYTLARVGRTSRRSAVARSRCS